MRRKKTLAELVIDFLAKERVKQPEGENPMFYQSPYFPPMMMPGQQQIDPIMLHNFINEQLEKQKKEADEKKKKDEAKIKWPFNVKFSLAQTVLITMTVGLVGGFVQLQLLYTFKQALLRMIQ